MLLFRIIYLIHEKVAIFEIGAKVAQLAIFYRKVFLKISLKYYYVVYGWSFAELSVIDLLKCYIIVYYSWNLIPVVGFQVGSSFEKSTDVLKK